MRGAYLLFILCFSQLLEGKNVTRDVTLEFKNNCLTLSKENKIKIINEYLELVEGDWLCFSTTSENEIRENKFLAFKNSKIRNRVIGNFLIANGIQQNNLIYKYNLFENLWVNKPSKLKSSVRVENRDDKSNQTTMSFRNIEGTTFSLPSGNIIEFSPMSFEGFSDDVITVTIKEYITKADFVKYGVTANGDKGMLETQGMYHVEAKSNNQKISLRRNRNYTLKIKDGQNESPFYSFYGKEKNGQVVWAKNGQEKFYLESSEESNEISSFGEEEYNDGFIEVVGTEFVDNEYGELEPILIKEIRRLGDDLVGQFSSLGWINCDRFYDAEETITMKLSIDNGISEKGYSVYIIFKDINSVLPLYSVTNGTYKTPKIPKDSTVTIFAIQMEGNEMKKLAFKEVIASDKKVFNLTSKKVNKNQVEKMMKDIIF